MDARALEIAEIFGYDKDIVQKNVFWHFGESHAHCASLRKYGIKVKQGIYRIPVPGSVVQTLAASYTGTTAVYIPVNQVEESEDEIRKRINRRFEVMGHLVTAAVEGHVPALIVGGPPGLGKSHETNEALKNAKNEYTFNKGKISPTGLYEMLWEHRQPGKVLVLDDCDAAFKNEDSLNILKAATDSTRVREVSWMSPSFSYFQERGIDLRFEFCGSIVVITNLDFDKLIAEGTKLAPHYAALISRSHYIDLGMKKNKDFLVRVHDVMADGKMMAGQGMTKAQSDMILQYIKDNADTLREISLRVAVKLANLIKMNDKNWQTVAKITMMKDGM